MSKDIGRESSCDTARASPVYTDDPVTNAMMDFLDERADAWMHETHIVSTIHAMCAMLGNGIPRPLLAKFRNALEAQFHLCFVEGGFHAWKEISAQQRSLGAPLPPLTTGSTPTITGNEGEGS